MTPAPGRDVLAADLHNLLRRGLPLSDPGRAGSLLDLRGVTARSTAPEPEARLRALEGLLRWQLACWDHELAASAQMLFGTAGTAGTTWTERRQAAAAAAGREFDHFRKRIEPKLCDLVAGLLLADSEAFGRAHAQPPALSRSRTRLRLEPDPFAWEACEHERMLSQLWAAIYALRADLLDVARRASMTGPGPDLEHAADTALWRYGHLLAAADAYRTAWGEQLLHSETKLSPRELARLAGWVPDLEPRALDRISTTAATTTGPDDFLAALPAGDREAWHTLITADGRTR
jgi:hypothetical protein